MSRLYFRGFRISSIWQSSFVWFPGRTGEHHRQTQKDARFTTVGMMGSALYFRSKASESRLSRRWRCCIVARYWVAHKNTQRKKLQLTCIKPQGIFCNLLWDSKEPHKLLAATVRTSRGSLCTAYTLGPEVRRHGWGIEQMSSRCLSRQRSSIVFWWLSICCHVDKVFTWTASFRWARKHHINTQNTEHRIEISDADVVTTFEV